MGRTEILAIELERYIITGTNIDRCVNDLGVRVIDLEEDHASKEEQADNVINQILGKSNRARNSEEELSKVLIIYAHHADAK